ncbi:MAG: HDOD domain-containing protein [Syntrophales bacterium]
MVKHNKLDALLKGWVELSSLPFIYIRISNAINDHHSSISDISDIISGDPSLTTRLLRLVNSAFYGFPSKIDTVSRALMAVGTNQIRDLAMATSVLRLFRGIPSGLVSMDSLWRHSVACGVAAKMLVKARPREANVERFFTAGIIHDIGRLAIYKMMPDVAQEMILRCRVSNEPLCLVEKEVIGFDHSDLGRAMAQLWNLPASLEETIAYHHFPWEARQYPFEAAVVYIADYMVHEMQLGDSGEQYIQPLDKKVWKFVGIPESVLSSMSDPLKAEFEDVVQSLEEL